MEATIRSIGERTAPQPFERFAGLCAILAGMVIFLYSVSFIVLSRSAPALGSLLSALLLTLSGLLITAALVAIYERIREVDASFALWALLLGLAGALGSAIHGGYDLALAINPPASPNLDLPNQVDPRGLLTFGVAGLAAFVVASLIARSREFSRGLAYLGYAHAILLIVIYTARLTILDVQHPVLLVSVLLAGFIVSPVWYIWLGMSLRNGRSGGQ